MSAARAKVMAVLTDQRTLLRAGLLAGLLAVLWPAIVVVSIGRFVRFSVGDLLWLGLQGCGWGAIAGVLERLERRGARHDRPVLTGLVAFTSLWALYAALLTTLAYAAASVTGGPAAGYAAVAALLERSWVQNTAFAGLIFAAPHAALAATRAARANGWAQGSLTFAVTSAAFLASLPPDPLGFIPRADLALFAVQVGAAVALPIFGVAWLVDRRLPLALPTAPAAAPRRRRSPATRPDRDDGSWRWIVAAAALVLVQGALFHERPEALRARRIAAAIGDLDDPSPFLRDLAGFRLLAIDARKELVDALLDQALDGDPVAASMVAGLMTEADRERLRTLADSPGRRRAPALRLLRAVADSYDLPRFVQALRDRDPRVRTAALRALAGQHDPGARSPLTAFVNDPLQQHRGWQERGFVDDVRASRDVAALSSALRADPSPDVRAGAADLLAVLARRDRW